MASYGALAHSRINGEGKVVRNERSLASVTSTRPIGGCGHFRAPIVTDPVDGDCPSSMSRAQCVPSNAASDHNGAILLTNGGHQRGTVWWDQPVPIDREFLAEITFSLRDSSANGPADGLWMGFSNDPSGIFALGSPGDLLDSANQELIKPFWSVIIDTHDLPSNKGGVYTVAVRGIWANGTHIDRPAGVWEEKLPLNNATYNLGDGSPWTIRIHYNVSFVAISFKRAGALTVAWSRVFDLTLDNAGATGLVTLFEGRTSAYLGFQGSTGQEHSTQIIEKVIYTYQANPVTNVTISAGNNTATAINCTIPYFPPPVPLSTTWIVTIVIASALFLLLLLMCYCCCCRRSTKTIEEEELYGYEDEEGNLVILGTAAPPTQRVVVQEARITTLLNALPIHASLPLSAGSSGGNANDTQGGDVMASGKAQGGSTRMMISNPLQLRTPAVSANKAEPPAPAVSTSSEDAETVAAAATTDSIDAGTAIDVSSVPVPEGSKRILVRQVSVRSGNSSNGGGGAVRSSLRFLGGGAATGVSDVSLLVQELDEEDDDDGGKRTVMTSGAGRKVLEFAPTAVTTASSTGAIPSKDVAAVGAAKPGASGAAPAFAPRIVTVRRVKAAGSNKQMGADKTKSAPSELTYDTHYEYVYIGGQRVAKRVPAGAAGGTSKGFGGGGIFRSHA